MTVRCAAVALVALLTSGCGGGDDDDGASREDAAGPTTSGVSSTTAATVKAGPTTIVGDELSVTLSGHEAVVGPTDLGFGAIVAVAGDEVYLQQFDPIGSFTIARIDLATAEVDRSEPWRDSIDTPLQVTRDYLWWGSPESADPKVRGVRGFSVLHRSTLAVVGHYPLPGDEFAIALVTIGETAYTLSADRDLGGFNDPQKYFVRTLTADGVYGQSHVIEPANTMAATDDFLVLVSPTDVLGRSFPSMSVLDPSTFEVLGRTERVPNDAGAGAGSLVSFGGKPFDVSDPANIAKLELPPGISTPLLTRDYLLDVRYNSTIADSGFDVAVYNVSTFQPVRKISGRTRFTIKDVAHDEDRLCVLYGTGPSGITCVTIDEP